MPEKRSAVVAVEAFPALCFRHDMDSCNRDDLLHFIEQEQEFSVPSTCFFLRYQVKEAPDLLAELSASGHEIGLHSEARPFWNTSLVQLLWFVEIGYRRKLRRQVNWLRRRGFDPQGHSPHSINNYLGFQNWINWNVIEQATIGSGMKYISDWRIIASTPEGAPDFPEPLPPFYRVLNLRKILVIPTSWDDKFFFSSYEDRFIRKNTNSAYKGRSLKEALDNIAFQLGLCIKAGIPFVVNLHPYNGLRGKVEFGELKTQLIEMAKDRKIPVLALNDLAERLALKNREVSPENR
ncbi:MAG TPA: polysaccharide deacetylase family protein [archaeon]|nr:polysaccharide deacetylase family protein [archaeon]